MYILRNARTVTIAGLLALGGAGFLLPSCHGQDAPAARSADPQVERTMSVASGHHELAKLYIKKGDLDAAVSEARKILQLKFPAEHEHLVAQSLAIIADKLGESHRFDLSQRLLDETFKSLDLVNNRIAVLLTKARLYKQAGDDTRAIDAYKRAVDLGGSGVRGTAR
jgi:tetratricopeptide (TPR) repeat protein